MSLWHRLGRQQIDFLRSFWNWHITLSYSFGIETANTFIRSLENHTRFQTKIGKVSTRLQTTSAKKKIPFLAAHTCIAYIREYPLTPTRNGPVSWSLLKQESLCEFYRGHFGLGNLRGRVVFINKFVGRHENLFYCKYSLEMKTRCNE